MKKSEIRLILSTLNTVPQKRFGQNFFLDQDLLALVCAQVSFCQQIVEVGPGLGALTQELMKYGPLSCYEIDESLAPYLTSTYPEVNFIFADFLSSNLSNLGQFSLVGNVPYHITTKIIRHALNFPGFTNALLLIEEPCFNRLFAGSDPSLDAFIIRHHLKAQVVQKVAGEAFFPKGPDSSVFIIAEKIRELDPDFIRFLRPLFTHKRKKIGGLVPTDKYQDARVGELTWVQLEEIYRASKSIR